MEATQKYVLLDQGAELHGSPQTMKIFKKHNHTMLLTDPDASNQNPVERHHQTVANAVRPCCLVPTCQSNVCHIACSMASECLTPHHPKVKLSVQFNLPQTERKIELVSRLLAMGRGSDHQEGAQQSSDQLQEKSSALTAHP